MTGCRFFVVLMLLFAVTRALAECAPAARAGFSAVGSQDDNPGQLSQQIEALAEDGEADAQYEIGLFYFDGNGVLQDYQIAREWFLLAAEQEDVFAQEILGDMYRDGLGVQRDYRVAIEWYRRAAEQWLATAQYKLGLLYLEGTGVSPDHYEAFRWFKSAAAQGYSDAQIRIGDMYAQGIGVEIDDALAYMWFYIPALGGCAEAIEKRDRSRERLNLLQAWAMQYTASDCIDNQFQGC